MMGEIYFPKDVTKGYGYSFLRCLKHHPPALLEVDGRQKTLVCPEGHTYPIVDGIPRFVPHESYVASFGLQWNYYRKTQLDSFTGLPISHDRLERMAGGTLAIFAGRNVLEAGCGAGRFTEVMLNAGASVFAVDLSNAVEASYQNMQGYENYFICQADIRRIPVEPEQFDIVVCIGVVQHTPNPEETMAALCSHVKPGGLLIMDHYTYGYPATRVRRLLRAFLTRRSPAFSLRFCRLLTRLLWPLHRALWRWAGTGSTRKILTRARALFLRLSPVVDYHQPYPQIGPDLLYAWAVLDTHDTLTDVYKHLRSVEEITRHLQRCGMVDVEAAYAGNGVEVRAYKPSDA